MQQKRIATYFAITAITALFLGTGMTSAYAADNGKVQGQGTSGGNRNIRVIDPDGVKTVTWYNSDHRNDANRSAEGSKTFSCVSDTGSIFVGTGFSHPHGHDVEYTDCKKNSEEWEVRNYFTNWQDGSRLSGDDDDTAVDLEIKDINLDGYPDLIVANQYLGQSTVTVMLSNGDGTFRKDPDDIYQLEPVIVPSLRDAVELDRTGIAPIQTLSAD